MALYVVGSTVALAISVRDADGVLANATAVTLTVDLPDGTSDTVAVSTQSVGMYYATYEPATAGRYTARWVATGTNASSYNTTFTVVDAYPLVSLDELKEHLNITSTKHDNELERVLLSASEQAELVTGRSFRRRSVVSTFTSRQHALVLPQGPVLAVTKAVEDGTELAASDYVLVDGVVYRGTVNGAARWGTVVTVTYTVGEASPPATASELVLELARHKWRTQRGSSPGGSMQGDDYQPGAAYVLTYRARELADILRLPGLA